MITHSDLCLAAQAKQAEWDALWPNACKECDATGYVSYYEPIDEIGGKYQSDECEGCMASSVCPRCGHVHDDDWNVDADEACVECGWDAELTDPSMWRPVAHCECWEVEFDKALREMEDLPLPLTDDEDYDYYADDLAFDAARERRLR